MKVYAWKRGKTFRFSGYLHQAGVARDLTGLTIQSKVIRQNGELLSTADITPRNQVTETGYFDAVVVDTTAWPLEQVLWDVKVLEAGEALYTQTVRFNIERNAT